MKKIFILFFLTLSMTSFAQETVAWDYPVKPGGDEWRYSSYSEKLQKNQPPRSLINSLNSGQLLELCVRYPFNRDILLFNNPNYGTRKVLKESLCWQEFIARKDAVETLLLFYSKFSTGEIEAIPDQKERNNKKFDIYFVEKVISESEIIYGTDISTRKQLLEKLLEKYNEKKGFPGEYFGYAYYSSLNAISKILVGDKAHTELTENPEYNSLVERGICNSELLETEIISKTKSYLAQ